MVFSSLCLLSNLFILREGRRFVVTYFPFNAFRSYGSISSFIPDICSLYFLLSLLVWLKTASSIGPLLVSLIATPPHYFLFNSLVSSLLFLLPWV